MGQLSVVAEEVLPNFFHESFQVDTEVNICIHKICPREKKSVFNSFKKIFSCYFKKNQEEESFYCRSKRLPASMRQITENLRERFEKKEIDYTHYI